MAQRVNFHPLGIPTFDEVFKEKTARELETMLWRFVLAIITAYVAYCTFLGLSIATSVWLFPKGRGFFCSTLILLTPIFLLLIEYLFFFLIFKSRKFWRPNIFTFFIKTIIPTVSLLVAPFCGDDWSLFVAFVTGAASSLYSCMVMRPLEDLRITESLLSLFLAYMVYLPQNFVFNIVLVLLYMDSWQKSMIQFTSSSSTALRPSSSISNSNSDLESSQLVNSKHSFSVHHDKIDTFFPRSDVAYTTIVDGDESLMEFTKQLAMGEVFGITVPGKKLDVDIATLICVKDDGPKRSLRYIETANIQRLLIEIKERSMSNTSINVETDECDIEGLVAIDKFHVNDRGATLNSSLSRKADSIQMPNFLIDQNSDPDATILHVSFVNRFDPLIDTMRVLEDFGLVVVKVTVAIEGSVTWAKFFVSHLATGHKVEDLNILERIHLRINNSLLKYGQLDVDNATLVHAKDDGSKRMRAVSRLPYIETFDIRSLLSELKNKYVFNTNINVESGEIETEGLIAKDKFHVSDREAALNSSLSRINGGASEEPYGSRTNRGASKQPYGLPRNGGASEQPYRSLMNGRTSKEPD